MEDLPSVGGGDTQQVSPASIRRAARGPGEELELSLNAGEIMLFDPEGGASLTSASRN